MNKLNTDGSFIHSTEKAGIGGILRDEEGDIIFAFSIPVQSNSSNMAEALAAKFGLDRCIQHGVHNISLELDSMLITNLIKQGHSSNIFLKPIIDDIKEMVKDANIEVSLL
ncbi:hypothetical protein KY289_016688 [Solanum tuberosum]|uniref:RNase H family protein n=1 Tax=Solanum tuberosum TaxID=4113 RepID=M1BYZ3_SOLTU|nr:hypothetical protein KY289_016688 [Solanum tuberosum]